MYQVGDLIVYGGTGVCRVMEVGPQTGGRLYYTLEPVYGSCRIFTPVENSKVLMRPIVTRQEAERLIDDQISHLIHHRHLTIFRFSIWALYRFILPHFSGNCK